jgi:hypothetical protein
LQRRAPCLLPRIHFWMYMRIENQNGTKNYEMTNITSTLTPSKGEGKKEI